MEDPNKLTDLNDLAAHLASFMNSGAYVNNDFKIIEVKKLVAKVNNLRIEIYSREHPPPHFHVIANESKAEFRIENCELWKGNLKENELRAIRDWYKIGQNKLIQIWNDMRSTDCLVGEYRA